VDSGCRGTGLGRALVQQLVAMARLCACDEVLLNCSEENAAFYAKCGFTASPEGRECYARYTDAERTPTRL
jgi:GNAT superfamily N-acetyltransferase